MVTRLTYSKQGSPADSDNLDNHGAILYGEADDVRYDVNISFEFWVQAVNAVGPRDRFTYTHLSNLATPAYDYDNDNDGLIEIDTTGRLKAVRYDLNGDGAPENEGAYTAVFPGPTSGMGCPASGCVGYELTADLDLGSVLDWQSIGSPEHPYVGVFEGNGRVISRLRILSSFTDNWGLFGALGADGDRQGVVRNLGMRQVQVFARDGAGGLVGQNNGGAILNSYVTGSVQGRNRVGGLAGSSAGRIGGSYATVEVTGAEYVGGLVGRNDADGKIIAGYATGKVAGNGRVGGLAGFNGGRIIAAYAAGAVRGPFDSNSLAGLVGWNTAAGTVTDSCSNTDNSGRASSLGGPGVADPTGDKTTAELQTPTGYDGAFANWNVDLDDTNAAGNAAVLTHDAVAAASGHRVDGVRPTFASAAVSADGAAVSLAFSEPIGVPPLLTTLAEMVNLQVAVFYIAVTDVMVDGRPVDVGGAAITQGRLVLRPRNAIAQSQTVTVAQDNIYAAHAAGLFIDAAGNALPNFAAQAAVNNSTVGEAAPVDDASDVVTPSRNEIKVGEGQTETYTAQLASEPSASVEVSIASVIGEGQLTAEGYEVDGGLLLNTDKLTFTTENWNVAQTITLRAPEDANQRNHWVTLRHTTTSDDSSFDGLRTKVRVVMADND